jgi:hypothetical protein
VSEWDGVERRERTEERRERHGWGVNFSSTIELGHIIQAGIMLVTLCGWALVGYQRIDRQLVQHQNDMALFQQRMNTDEGRLDQMAAALQAASTETRAALSKIIDQMGDVRADVRAAVAAQGRDGARR